jgi:hypothetical protein
MLMDRAQAQAGQRCSSGAPPAASASSPRSSAPPRAPSPVGVVSSTAKGRLVEQLGARGLIDRNEFAGMMRRGAETPEEEKARFAVSRDFAKRVKQLLGDAPDIVFEHVGRATFPTSVFVVKPFGKVVICGATSGYELDFDVRYLWMRQKADHRLALRQRVGVQRRQPLIEDGLVRPVLWRTMAFDQVARPTSSCTRTSTSARSRSSSVPSRGPRPRGRRPGRDPRGGRARRWPGSSTSPGTRPGCAATSSRPRSPASPRSRCATARARTRSFRYRDDRYKFLQTAEFEGKAEMEAYWYGEEFTDFRALASGWYQVPVVYGWTDLVVAGIVEPEPLAHSVRRRPRGSEPGGDLPASMAVVHAAAHRGPARAARERARHGAATGARWARDSAARGRAPARRRRGRPRARDGARAGHRRPRPACRTLAAGVGGAHREPAQRPCPTASSNAARRCAGAAGGFSTS